MQTHIESQHIVIPQHADTRDGEPCDNLSKVSLTTTFRGEGISLNCAYCGFVIANIHSGPRCLQCEADGNYETECEHR